MKAVPAINTIAGIHLFLFCFFPAVAMAALPCSSFAKLVGPSAEVTKAARFLNRQLPHLANSKLVSEFVSALVKRDAHYARLDDPAVRLAAWLEYLTHTANDAETKAELIHAFLDANVIKPEAVPQSYYKLQQRIAREHGHGNVELTNDIKNQLQQDVIADQTTSLTQWLDYLFSRETSHYAMWEKTWALAGILPLAKFNIEKQNFESRSKQSIAPFPELNREALALTIGEIQTHYREGNSSPIAFSKQYAKHLVVLAKVKTTLSITKGTWRKFDQGSSATALASTLQGRQTGWCTASENTAQSQLKMGEFYIYYSHDGAMEPTVPRIAIRMEGDQIAEVRGVAKDQNLDPYIAKAGILEEKLHQFGDRGKQYRKKSSDMKRLTEIDHRLQASQKLSADDLMFLYEVQAPIEGFGFQRDPRIAEFRQGRSAQEDANLALSSLPETVEGNLNLDLRQFPPVETLTLPTIVKGALTVVGVVTPKRLVLPHFVGGDINLTSLTSVDSLTLPRRVYGSLRLPLLTHAGRLVLPEIVDSQLELNKLTDGNGLKLPRHVGGMLRLDSLRSLDGVQFPKYLGGDLSLTSITTARNVKLPAFVGGNIYLWNLAAAEEIVFPKKVGERLELHRLQSAQRTIFPKEVGGSLFLERLTLPRKNFFTANRGRRSSSQPT